MKVGGQIPWNVTPICETFKRSFIFSRRSWTGPRALCPSVAAFGSPPPLSFFSASASGGAWSPIMSGGSFASVSSSGSIECRQPTLIAFTETRLRAHFPEDRNCEICKRTTITRAPCRRRNSGTVPRAENFGDLITADHKLLSDNCESRNNHRHAVVVQDLATQWIQPCPCKKKNFTRNPEKLAIFDPISARDL